VMSIDGRALNLERSESYAARRWLARDGDGTPQDAAYRRDGISYRTGLVTAKLPSGARVAIINERRVDTSARDAACEMASIVLVYVGAVPNGACEAYGPKYLRPLGSISITETAEGFDIRAAATGRRLWSGAGAKPHP
ncbi:MAG: hypothetical protein AAF568_09485, partial [Pseudomonadota bacterium]